MKVSDIMTTDVQVCRANTDLAAAGELLWAHDCGVLPVIDDNGKVLGVITDRDISIAVATRDRRPSQITAGEVMSSGNIQTCHAEDELGTVLKKMQSYRIRRLPVVNKDGVLSGILSLNDVAVNAQESRTRLGSVTYEDLARTMKAICEPSIKKEAQGQAHAFAGQQNR